MQCVAICKNKKQCSRKVKCANVTMCGIHMNCCAEAETVDNPCCFMFPGNRRCKRPCEDPWNFCKICLPKLRAIENEIKWSYYTIFTAFKDLNYDRFVPNSQSWTVEALLLVLRECNGYPKFDGIYSHEQYNGIKQRFYTRELHDMTAFVALLQKQKQHSVLRVPKCEPCLIETEISGLISKMKIGSSEQAIEDTLTEMIECVICKTNKKEYVFPLCGHLCVCPCCVPDDNKCPLCRKVSKAIRVFY